jgi:ferredoxin
MLDVGERLEPDRRAALDHLRSLPVADWSSSSDVLKENSAPDVGGLPKKLLAGSDFPFRWLDSRCEIISDRVDTLTSHALGGLSNIWGANLLPLLRQDTDTWEIESSILEPYYKKVTGYVPLAATADELEEHFPMHAESYSPLPQSRQAQTYLRRLRGRGESLRRQGVYFGGSRLAVRAAPHPGNSGCVACGLCLYGCPNDLIYCSSWTVADMRRHDRFQYQSGWLVVRLEPQASDVRVIARRIDTGVEESFVAERVFVGAGVVNSTRLLLASLRAFNEPIEIKDSQYLLVPLLKVLPTLGVTSERLHGLSQVCLGFLTNRSTQRSIHGLIYTYNDLFLRAVTRLAGPLAPWTRPIIRHLMGHLSVYQAYLHSDDSHSLIATLELQGERERVLLGRQDNPRTPAVLSELRRKLLGLSTTLGAVPLTFMSQVAMPGKSYHIGSRFPMSKTPGRFGTYLDGSVHGLDHVYSVDAANFPSVPATNLTFTSMANAYRIGFES